MGQGGGPGETDFGTIVMIEFQHVRAGLFVRFVVRGLKSKMTLPIKNGKKHLSVNRVVRLSIYLQRCIYIFIGSSIHLLLIVYSNCLFYFLTF